MALTAILPAPAGGLRVTHSITRTLMLIGRNWPTFLVLEVVFGAVPVLTFWVMHGFGPSLLERLPPYLRLPQLAFEFVLTTWLAASITRVAVVDRLYGRKLTPWRAAMMPPREILPLYFAAFATSFLTNGIYVFSSISSLPDLWYLSASIGVISLNAIVSGFLLPAVPVVIAEKAGGWQAIVRAMTLTEGHRALLAATFMVVGIVLFLTKWGSTEAVTLYLMNNNTLPFSTVEALRSAYWETFSACEGVFFAVWTPILYMALRHHREGLDTPGSAEVFD